MAISSLDVPTPVQSSTLKTAVHREITEDVTVFWSETGALNGRIALFVRRRRGAGRLTVEEARRLVETLQQAIEETA